MNRNMDIDKHPYFVVYCVKAPAWQQQLIDNNPFVGYTPIDDPPVVADSYAFVGETQNVDPPPTLTPIATPETQDVFHSPQFEESLCPVDVYQCTLNEASCDVDTEYIDLDGLSEESLYPIHVDAYQCTLNKVSFDVDTEFIDLDGFSENVDPKLVPSCSRAVVADDGVGVLERDISNLRGKAKVVQEAGSVVDAIVIGEGSRSLEKNLPDVVGDDEVGVLERDSSNLRTKKAKVVQEAGSAADAIVIGEGSRILEKNSRDVVGDDEVGVLERDISNLRGKKAKVVQEAGSAADATVVGEASRILEKNSLDVVGDDEVGVLERDISNLRGKKAKVVQEAGSGVDATVVGEGSRILEENSVIGEGSRMPNEDSNESLFDILKALAEDSNEDDDGGGGITLLKAFINAGMTFPRPRWWPDHFKSIFDMEKPQCKRKL